MKDFLTSQRTENHFQKNVGQDFQIEGVGR